MSDSKIVQGFTSYEVFYYIDFRVSEPTDELVTELFSKGDCEKCSMDSAKRNLNKYSRLYAMIDEFISEAYSEPEKYSDKIDNAIEQRDKIGTLLAKALLRDEWTWFPFWFEVNSEEILGLSRVYDRATELITGEDNIDDKERKRRDKARRMARQMHPQGACLVCGKKEGFNIHRHHYSYNEPTDIFMLCLQHHFGLHAHIRSLGIKDFEKDFTKDDTIDWITTNNRKPKLQESPELLQLQQMFKENAEFFKKNNINW